MLNYKFRLYPTEEQEKRLQNNLAVCRWVYNRFVEQTKNAFLTRNDMNYFLVELKQSEPWLYNYHSKMLQMVSDNQLDDYNRILIYYLFLNYNYNLDDKQKQTVNKEKLMTALKTLPEYLATKITTEK